MTKVKILRLDSTTENDTAATLNINTNFENIQKAIENSLSRDGSTPNYMDADLDMNSYRIINVGTAVDDTDAVSYKQFKEETGAAVASASQAAASAAQAANSAQSALVSSTNAINSVRNAEEQLNNVIVYVDEAKQSIDNTINDALADVKQQALDAAQESIDTAAEQATTIVIDHAENVIKPELNALATSADEDAKAAAESATLARTWATGSDDEVQAVEPDEHSSRTYANFSMALANAPEDVPVLESTLLATDVVKGPKGDSGDAEFSGDVDFEGSFNVHGDDNHPVKVTSLAGTSASGYQVVDSNGLGDSDFEHYATGDRYGTRITNHNNTSNTSVSVDLYQSNVGKSVLDLSDVETILAPALLKAIYPVGSIYITTAATCPMQELGAGTWEIVAEDRVLQGAGTRGAVGTTVDESLPNITGSWGSTDSRGGAVIFDVKTGAFSTEERTTTRYTNSTTGTTTADDGMLFTFDASRVSSTYQDNAPVQPDAYLVNIFRRIS